MYDNRNRTHHHESRRPHVDVDCLQDKLLLSDLPGELPTDREHKVIVENVSLVILCHAPTVPVFDAVYYAQMRHIQHTIVEHNEQCVSLFASSLPDRQSVLAVYVNQHTHLTLRNVGEVRDATDMRLVPPSCSSSEPLLLQELTIASRDESVYVDICHLRCDYMRVEVGEKSLVFCAHLEVNDALFMLYASAQAAIEVLQAKRVCVDVCVVCTILCR